MINWEEFGRSQLARTALNLSQLCRREASDLAFHRKAVARKMTGPHSHRGGHWFDPSIAHQVSRYVDLHAYVVLSLLVGVRTEEARALRWDHVDLESRRSLGLPRMAVEVLRRHLQRQADARLRAGVLWQDNGLVFTTALGTQLDAADVRRSLRTICRRADLGEECTPRELRHTGPGYGSGWPGGRSGRGSCDRAGRPGRIWHEALA